MEVWRIIFFSTLLFYAGLAASADTLVVGSEEWRRSFSAGKLGCTGGVTDPYEWRAAGFGSNINHLLLAWAHAILRGRDDVAVIVHTSVLFSRTTCTVASKGQETRGGWPCIFAPIPYLCTFDHKEDWVDSNLRNGVSQDEQDRIYHLGNIYFLKSQVPFIEQSVDGTGVDMFGLLAVLYDFVSQHFQPWFEADVQALLSEPTIASLRAEKYVSMHIRRTDKIIEAPATNTEQYFVRMLDYLRATTEGPEASEIMGLWLSSDDGSVFDEVQALAPRFFPRVKPNNIVFIEGPVSATPREPGPYPKVDQAVDRNTYEAMVILRVETIMLAGADVFCGTFSSNLGRLVALMRETLKKPRESTLSADIEHWSAG